MPDKMQEFQISQVTYVQKIRQSKFSTIFLVKVRCGGSTSQKSEEEEGKGKGKEKDKEKEKEKTCVMKVVSDFCNHPPLCGFAEYAENCMQYRNQRLPGVNPQREYSLFLCESRAYRRLEEKGLCKRGVVPQFYGVIRNMKPSSWADHLHMFCGDELLPNAVLLEYIPNMQMMDVPYFKSELLDKLERILKDIHVAGVLHDDPYPRNMMVVPGTSGTPDRVLWIDFDRAQTYPVSHTAQTETYPAPPLERQQTLFQSEAKMMRQFVEAAVRPLDPTSTDILLRTCFCEKCRNRITQNIQENTRKRTPTISTAIPQTRVGHSNESRLRTAWSMDTELTRTPRALRPLEYLTIRAQRKGETSPSVVGPFVVSPLNPNGFLVHSRDLTISGAEAKLQAKLQQ